MNPTTPCTSGPTFSTRSDAGLHQEDIDGDPCQPYLGTCDVLWGFQALSGACKKCALRLAGFFSAMVHPWCRVCSAKREVLITRGVCRHPRNFIGRVRVSGVVGVWGVTEIAKQCNFAWVEASSYGFIVWLTPSQNCHPHRLCRVCCCWDLDVKACVEELCRRSVWMNAV